MTRKEIEEYARAGDEGNLEALLNSRMMFGTAGSQSFKFCAVKTLY